MDSFTFKGMTVFPVINFSFTRNFRIKPKFGCFNLNLNTKCLHSVEFLVGDEGKANQLAESSVRSDSDENSISYI